MSVTEPHLFERNNYFYGKLLTSRDFKEEQAYFNQKRYLLNRLIHGYGIVWGLKVSDIDDHVIELGSGVALDEIGREVVAAKAVQTDIRDLNVFPPEAADSSAFYLVMEYEECPREPMPALTNAPSCKEECEPNRIAEGYKLALTNIPPPEPLVVGHETRHETATLLHMDKWELVRIVPKWVQAGDAFEVVLRLIVTNAIPAGESIVVDVLEELPDSFVYLFQDPMTFTLSDLPSGTVIDRSYVVRAGSDLGVFTIGGKTIVTSGVGAAGNARDSLGSEVKVIEEDTVYEQIVCHYFDSQEEGGWIAPKWSVVYLAQLQLGDNRTIMAVSDHVRSYVYSNPLLAELIGAGDDLAGKLLPHGLSHQAGESDPINVTNLSGVLADPQKVTVIDELGASFPASAIQFVGNGVKVGNHNQVAVVKITDTGGVVIPIPDNEPPVVTGRVSFNKMKIGEFRLSPEIKLPIQEPCAINLALELAADKTKVGIMGHLADEGIHLSAIYNLNDFTFQILFQDARSNTDDKEKDYTVRYWIIPPTEHNKDEDASPDPDLFWYKDYVLSRLILYSGRTIDQLSIDPVLRNKVKADAIKDLLSKLEDAGLVKHNDNDSWTAV
ncbi:hypothetical protein [Paenibacillus spongiae]|uniref:DUF11 domain-containing protein n=1 Tax=Paenibacillus spongiae TaxID=2909671 RepID=A0ABY5S0N4_9BACL|nr:hypothetical protein [Paenibacillus spongiae]UVI27391.1 hypothetical protein L1F29_18125 [Paenibacillus spongiae]